MPDKINSITKKFNQSTSFGFSIGKRRFMTFDLADLEADESYDIIALAECVPDQNGIDRYHFIDYLYGQGLMSSDAQKVKATVPQMVVANFINYLSRTKKSLVKGMADSFEKALDFAKSEVKYEED